MQCTQVLAFVTLVAKCYHARPVTGSGSRTYFRPFNYDEDIHVTSADNDTRTPTDGWPRRCSKNDSTLHPDTIRRRRYGGCFVLSHLLQGSNTGSAAQIRGRG
jgi:hypothetical protein